MESLSKLNSDKLHEGIDIDPQNLTVAFNPTHENYVDTSIENNPSVETETLNGIELWSIFRRKNGDLRGDGNPLTFALKHEKWKFRSKEDEEAIDAQFDAIAQKFVNLHPIGITIVVPSGNDLNMRIAEKVVSKCPGAKIVHGVLRKMTVEEVDDVILDEHSMFREYYKDKFNQAYIQLNDYFKRMEQERRGEFSRHYVKDPEMRNVINVTLKLSSDGNVALAKEINDQNILLIDDTVSRGQTLQEACRIINDCYSPRSITVLTLMSKQYKD